MPKFSRCQSHPGGRGSCSQYGDIVFGKRQPRDCYFAHKIQRIMWEEELVLDEPPATAESAQPAVQQPARRVFTVSNEHGKECGWCYDEDIYGRLVEVIAPSHPDSDMDG